MICTINFPESKPFVELANRYGSNKTMLSELMLAVQDPTPNIGKNFNDWYINKYGVEPNFDNDDSSILADRIVEFYYQGNPTVDATSIESLCIDEASNKGYSSTTARNEAITRACEFIFIQQSLDKIEYNINYTGNGTTYVKDKLRESVTDKIVSRICNKRNIDLQSEEVDDVFDEIEDAVEQGFDHLRDYIYDTFKDATVQDNNLIALYLEIMDDKNIDSFINDMIRSNSQISKIISSVKEYKDDSEEKTENKEASEDESENNEQSQDSSATEPNETGRDVSISNSNNHLGALPDFKLHVSDNIRIFLSSIYKLNSPISKDVNGTYDYNTDNELGLPSLMDCNQLMNVLYTCVDYTNGKSMLESIKMVAEQVPGMQGLIQVYDKLNTDKDLRYDFYRTFGKAIVSKLETVLNGNAITTRISNRRSDRLTSLYFEYYNSTKKTSVNLSEEVGNDLYNETQNTLNDIKSLYNVGGMDTPEFHIACDTLVDKLTQALRRHCPSIDSATVSNYLINNKTDSNFSFADNARTLLNIVDTLNKNSIIAKNEYNKQVNAFIDIRRENKRRKNAGYVNENQLEDESLVFEKEYADSMQAPTQELAKTLLNFTVIKTELNSRNVHGNLSSDVINCSMITNIMKTLQNEVALKNFGEYKSLTNQYNLSNILLEQVDENGAVISRGLFKNQNGKFVPTSYAQDLLKVRLFNGAGDENNGNNILYSEMSKGDYIATAIVNFFDENANTNGSLSIGTGECTLASYFMKIPSDAPKNFCITAPRYFTGTTGINGLFNFSDPSDLSKIDSFINDALTKGHEVGVLNGSEWLKELDESLKSNVPLPADMEAIAELKKLQIIGLREKLTNDRQALNTRLIEKGRINKFSTPSVSVNDLVNQIINLTGKDEDIITVKKGQFTVTPHNKESENDILIVNKCIAENGEETYYFIRGTREVNPNTKVVRLRNARFDGFLKYSSEFKFKNTVSSEIKDVLKERVKEEWIKNGTIKRVVNTNHPIFKQVRNAFIQELTDAATALQTIFEVNPLDANKEPGAVNYYKDNDGNLVPKFKDGYGNTKEACRKLYELYHLNKNKLLFTIKNGKAILDGKVFHSDRFIYTDRLTGKERNFGEEILEEAFDLLYGGGQDTYIHTAMINNRFVAVPTDKQMQVINAKLSEFLENYISDSINRTDAIIGKYNNLNSDLINVDNLTEFAANYLITYIGFNDLFEGDSKFYKSSQDILKRAKEVQGSGVPYGCFDITRPIITPRNTNNESGELGSLLEDSALNDTEFNRIDANGNLVETFKINHYPRFTGVTIANSITTGKTIGEFVKDKDNKYRFKDKNSLGVLSTTLKNIFISQGYTEEEAFNKTEEMMAGYADTTVNDAQSYITFEEWVRRITGRGQLKKYKPLIDRILDESQPLSVEDLTEFVQVQKNFYYDQHYNAELGVIAPRQIKNAEFVLVPRLIKGTELERVYNLMKAHNIDQLNTKETSKAAKCKILNLWTDDCKLDDKLVEDFEKHVEEVGYKEYYDYNYLYTQSETPQHMDDKNKAAIQIMKKIVDNIPYEVDSKGNPTGLYKKKLEFFDVYSENIHDNFEELMDALGVQLDKDGNIILDNNGNIVQGTNSDGSPRTIDYDLFFSKLDDEFRRQGLDSNLRSYIEQIAPGSKETKMPLDMGSFSSKVESIAQSLFNSQITRQTLPGYHAAQITNVGWNKLSDSVENVSYAKELRYHPDGQGYVEVMLPKSMFNFSKEMLAMNDKDLIDYIQSEHLDMSIGYRIPTEGKQSICVFKVVGFTNAALGSTIVVPNDWVSQTGSDFDIDSVYGITPEYYHDKEGMIHKVEYHDVPDLYDWFRYVNRNASKRENYKLKEAFEKLSPEIQNELNAEMDDLQNRESEFYHKADEGLKENIRKALSEIKKKKTDNNRQENYIEMLDEEYRVINEWLDIQDEDQTLSDDEYDFYANFANTCKDIARFIENAKDNYDSKKREKINNLISERKEKFDNLAKTYGLMSYDEFIKHPIKANTRKQRNNRILDIMIDILKDNKSLEENLSQSSFRYISDAKEACYKGTVAEKVRKQRSTYNFLDNADYQEDAMSGAKLKAFSVTRDTIVSVCNTAKAMVHPAHSIKVAYDYNKESFDHIKKAYAINDFDLTVEHKNDKIYVIHDRFGWSLNNHNVVDKILTSYDSQTTAYILDVIKEGNIPNVNDETFGVYKTFTDLGSSHLLSVAFMMQPGITEIVDNYNANKSIYQSGNNNAVHSAIKNIARKLGVTVNGELVGPKTKINAVIDALNRNDDIILDFNRLFNENNPLYKFDLDDTVQLSKMSIDISKLIDRIKNRNNLTTPVEERNALLHDLFIVLQYNKIKKLSDRIRLYGSVLNPDKFGAKQTIYATRKIFKDIERINTLEENNPIMYSLNNDGDFVSLLGAIYPGIDKGMDYYMSHDSGKSVYPPLNAFLKYSTCTSIKVNKNLFLTQNDDFINYIENIKNCFTITDTNPVLSEKVYNDYKAYVLSEIYSQIPLIESPIGIHIENPEVKDFVNRRYTYGRDNSITVEDERRRIFGYGKSIRTDLHINDLNDITDEELNIFKQYTPAQKVLWIQENFRDAGIFNYITANVTNIRNIQSQKLEFSEDQISPELAYTLFKKAFYNNNPIVKLAAYDLIKYGFVVEGFKMMHNGIAKKIVNDILINDNTMGVTVVDSVKNSFGNINDSEKFDFDRISRNFIRANHNINAVATSVIDKKHKDYFSTRYDGMIELSMSAVDLDGVNLVEEYNIGHNDGNGNITLNKFVKLKDSRKKEYTLYEIVSSDDYKTVYLVPLNKLNSFEHNEWSVNKNNNKYQQRDYYINLIKSIQNHILEKGSENLTQLINEYSIKHKKEHSFNDTPVETVNTAKPFELNDVHPDAYHKISNHFAKTSENNDEQFYFISSPCSNFITTPGVCDTKTGEVFCSIQTIEVNGVPTLFKIVKVNPQPYYKYIFGNKELNSDVSTLNNVINEAKNNKNYAFNMFYAEKYEPQKSVVKEEESTRDSKVSEQIITSGIRGIIARKESSEAARALSRLDAKDISVRKNNNTVAAHLSDAIEINAEYVKNTVEQLLNDCKYFCQNDGVYYSINDDYSIDLIKRDVDARNKYLKICNDARALVKSYDSIKLLDIEAEDENDKKNLRIIRENILKIDNNVIVKKAEERFVNDFLAKISSNPLVKSDIITLLDGYHSASFFDCYIGDLQESSNPLLQIVTKEAMSDIRGKEMKAKHDRDVFVKAVNAIINKARNAGVSIDMSHIIDDEGRFIQAYSQTLVDDMHAFQDKIRNAKEVYGVGSNEYQLASLEYKQWKLDYIHQIAPDIYYKNEIDNIKSCLIDPENPSRGFEPVYLRYCELNQKRFDVLSHMTADGVLDDAYKAELKDINREIDNLRSSYILDENGNFIDRYEVHDVHNPYTNIFDKLCYRPAAKNIINEFLSNSKKNRDDYFEKDAKFGFEEELEKNLTILNSYPKDEFGNYVTPLNLLMEDEKFAKAKEWIDSNATRIVPENISRIVKQSYEALKGYDGKSSKLKQIAKERDAYDNGVIDGTKLTDEDIKQIFDEQFDKYKYDYTNPFSDTMLMTAVVKPVTIFTKEFYRGLHRDISKNPEWVRCINDINAILKKVYSSSTNKISTSELTYEDLKKLNTLYNELADLRKYTSKEGGKRVFEFMNDYTEAVYDETTYEIEKEKAKARFGENSLEYHEWVNANSELLRDKSGNLILDAGGHPIIKPNHFLYGYIQPKGMYNLTEFIDDDTKSAISARMSSRGSTYYPQYTNKDFISILNLSGTTAEEKAQNFDISYKKLVNAIKATYPDIDIDSANKIIHDTFVAYSILNDGANSIVFAEANLQEEILDTDNLDYVENVFKKNTSKFIDIDKTNALRNIMRYTETVYTPYYYKKLEEMRSKSKEEYDAWYKANHIYNPYAHRMEALPCWYQTKIKNDSTSPIFQKDEYVPKWSQTETVIKESVRAKDKNGNYYYKEGYGNAFNYKRQPTDDDLEDIPVEARIADVDYHKYTRKDNRYDNTTSINSYEQELKDLMQKTLLDNAKTKAARKYVEKGYTAMRKKEAAHDANYWKNQALQMIGWTNSNSGNELWFEDEAVDYSRDRDITMPMLNRLGQRDLIRIPEGATEDEINEINKQNEEIKKENDKIKNELLDKNWIGAIEEFIVQAGHYNAVQDNKQLLFFAKNMLDRMEFFDKKVGQSDLHKNKADSTEDDPTYVKKHDEYLKSQYVNWLRRLLYEQYKEPNDWLTRTANILQSLTSSKFMMLNITGGIANVTLGVSQIYGEAFAKEYFGSTAWHKAHSIYMGGVTDAMGNMYNDTSTTKAGAIIKYFNVVDFDEIRGVVPNTLDFGNFLDRVRDATFSPQTMGEHYMQNTAMFAMMESHRVIENNDSNIQRENIAGLPNHKIMNEAEYVSQTLENKVKEIIGADRYKEFLKFKESITKDPNVTKDYAWFRKDPLHEFIKIHFTKEEKEKYNESKENIVKQAKETFAKAPKLIDQFELDKTTGHLSYAKDSLLSQLPEDDAYKLCGEFKSRVISVNKKIHGVYDRLGAAKIESSWWGSLVMQYHKHLYPGIMKRYRRKGYFNEERGTVEKGYLWSLVDFLKTPLDETVAEYKDMPEAERNALKSVQMFARHSIDFIHNFNINYKILPEYEKANIKRNLSDLIGWGSAILCAIALTGLGDDDDKDKFKNIAYNLALYESDRLASESFMYNPIGLVSEFKTLWSSPLACQSGIIDLATCLGEIAQWLIQGDDYNAVYKTGLYAGESKIRVKLTRQLPIYRSLERIWNLDRNNRYYKIGVTGTGIIPIKTIGDSIKESIN